MLRDDSVMILVLWSFVNQTKMELCGIGGGLEEGLTGDRVLLIVLDWLGCLRVLVMIIYDVWCLMMLSNTNLRKLD
jgi:hypothetical protein